MRRHELFDAQRAAASKPAPPPERWQRNGSFNRPPGHLHLRLDENGQIGRKARCVDGTNVRSPQLPLAPAKGSSSPQSVSLSTETFHQTPLRSKPLMRMQRMSTF